MSLGLRGAVKRGLPTNVFYKKNFRRGLAAKAVRPPRVVTTASLRQADAFNFGVEAVPLTAEEAQQHRAFAATAEGSQPLANVFAHTRGIVLRFFLRLPLSDEGRTGRNRNDVDGRRRAQRWQWTGGIIWLRSRFFQGGES